jgi:hypothetical protein
LEFALKASLQGIKIDVETEAKPLRLTKAQEAAADAAVLAAIARKREEVAARG